MKHGNLREDQVAFSGSIDIETRKSSLYAGLERRSTVLTKAINEALRKTGSLDLVAADATHISDYIIDLCTLTDSLTNGALSFLVSLKLHHFSDSKAYWKLIQKQLCRISSWICKDIEKKISILRPCVPILSRNVVPLELDGDNVEQERRGGFMRMFRKKNQETDKDNDISEKSEIDDLFGSRSPEKNKKRDQKNKLKKLALQMHSLDFVLSSLKHTKQNIAEQYIRFIHNEMQNDAKKWLEREVVIKLNDINICEFLMDNFVFIPEIMEQKMVALYQAL